jgi:hypothetical protein
MEASTVSSRQRATYQPFSLVISAEKAISHGAMLRKVL